MSDWTWEYEPDAENVVGGLDKTQRLEVEAIAQRIADAVGVRRIGKPFDITEAASGVRTFAEGAVMVWYQEDYRDDVVLVLRAQHFGAQHLGT
ncbi:hypothetical protein M5362_11390 [Streptomyces sp. Je 1-79]|uniref:hypothetical protein n=1 Tax=Streptomyces sp. Je 1-79 TaxID=2943847 RepID=UPI0021A81E5A|nr:hypothetical protein [Streptomyces sp. Je 1-79]MCT4353733.1 hypothetical protein [Streptomyces sp. Je 1-79]